jgi:predicted RNase H-like HicB family nuclease
MRNKSAKAIDRPFDPEVLRRARKIADSYNIVVQHKDGEYYGRGVELPYVMNDGKTWDECIAATRDALTTGVAFMLENGEVPPAKGSK